MRKNILITGGSSGLGLSLVKNFLAEGHHVATFSRKLSPEINELLKKNNNFI